MPVDVHRHAEQVGIGDFVAHRCLHHAAGVPPLVDAVLVQVRPVFHVPLVGFVVQQAVDGIPEELLFVRMDEVYEFVQRVVL